MTDLLKAGDALDVLLRLWNDQWRRDMARLHRIDRALHPPHVHDPIRASAGGGRYLGPYQPSSSMPHDAPPAMYELERKSRTTYLPLLVRTFRQALTVEGYFTNAPEEESPWRWWQRLGMDAKQVAFHDSALTYGSAYELIRPAPAEESMPTYSGWRPTSRGFTPKRLAAEYADQSADEWPQFTVHEEGGHLILYDELAAYRFGMEAADFTAPSGAKHGVLPDLSRRVADRSLHFIEAIPHELEHPPVVRYREETSLDGEEVWGIVEPLITIQERIDETEFGKLVAQYFAAFKQRAVIGWVPKSEEQELKASAGRMWYMDIDPKDVRIDELSETDLTKYIDASTAAKKDLASIAQIPAVDLGVDGISNISDATLSGLERGKNARSGEIARALGEDHEQAMRFRALIAGDMTAANDWASEVRWAEREARTWAGHIDGLVKLVAAEVLSHDTAVGMVPGLSEQQVQIARDDSRRARAAKALERLTGRGV